MADQKVTQLTEETTPTVDDLLYSIQDPAGTPADRKIQMGTLFGTMAQNYRSGLYISNNATDATNDIDISAGVASDSGNAYLMVLSSTLVKRLDAAWAVGTNQGGLDTGSIANTTYYVWLIRRPDTGVVDALFSTSSTSPTMPTNYTQKRLIGTFVRSGGAITAFTAVSSIDDHLRGLAASASQIANFVGLGFAWSSWTPTITVSGGTAPTYTAKFLNRYMQIGKLLIGHITWVNSAGGTAGAGTNAITFTSPVTLATDYSVANTVLGLGHVYESAGTQGGVYVAYNTSTTLRLQLFGAITNVVGNDQSSTDRRISATFIAETA